MPNLKDHPAYQAGRDAGADFNTRQFGRDRKAVNAYRLGHRDAAIESAPKGSTIGFTSNGWQVVDHRDADNSFPIYTA